MREQLEELRRENAVLRAQLAAAHAAPYQHQPYAVPSQPLDPALPLSPAPHRLDVDAVLSQDQRLADLAATLPSTPRPTVAPVADAMSGPEEDARGREREPGATPEKPVLKKAVRSVSVGGRPHV